MSYRSQESRIFNLLKSRVNEWVPLPEILALGIAQYGRAIHSLRKHHNIENKWEQVGQTRKSWFRLVEGEKHEEHNPVSTADFSLR